MIAKAAYSTAVFLAKTLPIVAIAFYLVSYSIKKGYLERFSKRIEPFLSKAGLSELAAISAATCFVSPTAGYSMISQAWREGKLTEKDVIAISFLNSFPSVFSHLYAFFIPFVIPVLGFAGIVYTATRFGVAAIKSLIGYVMAIRWRSDTKVEEVKVKPFSPSENLIRVGVIMAITYFLVSLASQYGVFNVLSKSAYFVPFPPNAIAISVVEFFNVRAAVVMAAGLISTGLSWKWAVIGLILGNVISFSARSIKHSLPMHLSLFGKFGVKIVILNAIATLILDIVFIAILIII